MRAAFAALEENEESLGWAGQGNSPCCGPPSETAMAYRLYKQKNPFDGPVSYVAE